MSLCHDFIKSKEPELGIFLPVPEGLRDRPAVPSPGVNPAHLSLMELEAGASTKRVDHSSITQDSCED